MWSGIIQFADTKRLVASLGAALLSLILAACNNDSTVGPTPPPPVTNTPPVIQSLTLDSARIEAGQDVQLTAVVQDAETPTSQLTYAWSASPAGGTFTSQGAQATWHAPAMGSTPSTYTLTLTVTEKYMSAGVQKENTVTSSAQVHYNDSVAEITEITLDFLTDFSTYSVTPARCVRNFSDNCPGKTDELHDVEENRALFEILGGTFSVSSVTLNSDRTAADIVAPCTFRDIVKASGVHEAVVGTCLLTAVYEGWQWFLCESHFSWEGTTTSSLRTRLRYSHP